MRDPVGAKGIQLAEVADRVGIGKVAGLSSGIPGAAIRNRVGRSPRGFQFMFVVLNEEERFVLAVVNLRNNDGAVESESVKILRTLWRRVRRSAGRVRVVVGYPGICIQPSTSRIFIHGPVKGVRTGLYRGVKTST